LPVFFHKKHWGAVSKEAKLDHKVAHSFCLLERLNEQAVKNMAVI